MRYSLGVAVALTSWSFHCVIASPPALLERQTTTQCAKGVHVICGAPNTYPAKLNLLVTLVDGILAAIPGSDYLTTPYDGSASPARNAAPVMAQEIAQYQKSCPKTPIALVGYSLGSIVVMNNLCAPAPAFPTTNIIAAPVYGDITYHAGDPWDKGTCQSSAPTYSRSNTAACLPYRNVIRSWCNAEDSVCCGTGNDVNAHYLYAKQYDQTAIDFVVQKYKKFRRAQRKAKNPPG